MRSFPTRRPIGMAVTLLATALTACSPDETPTAPGVVQQVPPPASPASPSRVEGYATRGERREGFVLDRAGKPMKVTYEVHNGVAVWQGDIELGRATDVATTPETARRYVRPGTVTGSQFRSSHDPIVLRFHCGCDLLCRCGHVAGASHCRYGPLRRARPDRAYGSPPLA